MVRATDAGQMTLASPMRPTVRPMVTTNHTDTADLGMRRSRMRSTVTPMSGDATNTTAMKASGAGTPQSKRSCQYRKAAIMPMAPWPMLNTPDVVYVSTSPELAMA